MFTLTLLEVMPWVYLDLTGGDNALGFTVTLLEVTKPWGYLDLTGGDNALGVYLDLTRGDTTLGLP